VNDTPDTPNANLPRLRGHHLICLTSFKGEGYDEPFVSNLFAVTHRLEDEGACIVVEGLDDVCVACPWLDVSGRCSEPKSGEDEIRRIDALALSLLETAPGDILALNVLRPLVGSPTVAETWRRSACDGCEWETVCGPRWVDLLGGDAG